MNEYTGYKWFSIYLESGHLGIIEGSCLTHIYIYKLWPKVLYLSKTAGMTNISK